MIDSDEYYINILYYINIILYYIIQYYINILDRIRGVS